MSQKKYFTTLAVAVWLYLCASVVFFYPYDYTFAIVFGVLGVVLGAALLASALISAGRGKFAALHITFAVTAAAAFAMWLIRCIDEYEMHIFGALVAAMFGAAYLLGAVVRRKDAQSSPFYRQACMFFAVLSLVCGLMPAVGYGTVYSGGYGGYYAVSLMSYSVNYFTLASAALALLGYWLDYCGRLTPAASHVIVGVGAVLSAVIAVWYGCDLDIFMAIGAAAVVLLCAAAYYVFACSRRGRELVGLCSAPEQPAGQSAPPMADKMAELEKINQLRAAGVLTEEEYAAQKLKIIGGNDNV